jgi:hypothetical protein
MTSLRVAVGFVLEDTAKADARVAGKPERARQLLAAMQRRCDLDTEFRNQVKSELGSLARQPTPRARLRRSRARAPK